MHSQWTFNGLCVDIGDLLSLSELIVSYLSVVDTEIFGRGCISLLILQSFLISSSRFSISSTEILDLLSENL